MKVYQPAEDSELLLQTALEEIRSTDVVLEVGTGSGFVASRIAGMCRLVVATDISPHAVREAKRSVKRDVEVIRTDLFSGLRRVFTLILFNPPYLELEDEEKRGDWMDLAIDGGRGGVNVAIRFLERLKEVMVENGRAILILSTLSDLKKVERKCEELDYQIRAVSRKKLFFEELIAYKITFKFNQRTHSPARNF